MKKIGLILVVLVLTGVMMSGCGAKAQPTALNNVTKIESNKMAEYIVENTTFKDDMSPVDKDIFLSLYNLDGTTVKDVALYASTGATAEEVAVITGVDQKSLETIQTACEQRVEAQKQAFENYVPEELTKLKTPVIKQIGDSIVFVVCDDSSKAEELIDNYTNTEV